MARRPRVAFKGAVYHVCFRGNARKRIFVDNRDRCRFLASLADRVHDFQVRHYLYCLMTNHVHLLLETPCANISQFMESLLTSYAVYFNLRHDRCGHLTQGRFKSPLVQGDEYLLRLSRYIHLNPVFVGALASSPIEARRAFLRAYRWSSYPAYAGLGEPEDFVDYGPVLALVGHAEANLSAAYRGYVELGLSQGDEEFVKILHSSSLGVGSTDFQEELNQRYSALIGQRVRSEDVAFRRVQESAPAFLILECVCAFYNLSAEQLRAHRKRDRFKPIAAWLLTKLGGLTQREVASLLGLSTGAAVCLQLKGLKENPWPGLAEDLRTLESKIQAAYLIFKG